MSRKILVVGAWLLLTLLGCAQAVTPAAVVTPPPSATLERAPTRTPIVHDLATPGGPAGASKPARAPATLIGTPVPPPHLTGKFVFSPGDGSIWIQDAATGRPQVLVNPTSDVFADAPSFAPDGKSVAYTESKLSSTGVAVNSIHLIDADGKNGRVLATPADVKTTLNWPVFSPDGKWVYYTSSFPVPPNSEHSEIQRMASAGGAPQKVIQDAVSTALSADGSQIAFERFNFTNFSASLWIADADGQNARLLVADDLFSILLAPHFSPDGKWILFAASGPPNRPLPGSWLLPHRRCEPQLLCALAATAHADGLPWDLWVVSINGKHFEQLTNVGFDSPWPAWSRDGKYIAVFETSGFYVLEVEPRLLSQWKAEGGHGIMDWWMPNS